MDILGVISSVSRLAIGAFAITLIVVGYEVYVLMKKRQGEVKEKKDIKLPDFNKDPKVGDFTPVDIDPNATMPVEKQSRKLSRKFLPVLLVLLVLIVLTTGYLIYRRNQVSSVKVDVGDVSPVGQDGAPLTDSEGNPLDPSDPNAQGDGVTQGGLNLTPTVVPDQASVTIPELPQSTPVPTVASNGEVIIAEGITPTPVVSTENKGGTTAEPTPTVEVVAVSPTVAPTSTVIAAGTSTPVPTSLPQAGTYHTTLIIVLVSISVIYLALIL